MPITLITFGMFRGPAALTRIIWPIGVSMPPPTPWRTRKAISSPLDHGERAQAPSRR